MSDKELATEWLKRAKSNLEKAKLGLSQNDIYLEDFCFDAQQAAEKAIKAILILKDIEFQRAHSIGYLLDL